MAARSKKLPPMVHLPAAATMATETAHLCLGGQSRQLISLWRKTSDFPASHGGGRTRYYLTDELQRWLIARGVNVVRGTP